jgi:hypothetical protein
MKGGGASYVEILQHGKAPRFRMTTLGKMVYRRKRPAETGRFYFRIF